MVTKNTLVEKSDKKFNIPVENEKVSLNQLSGMPPFTRITCEAKVFQVDEVIETANGKITERFGC